MIVIPLTMISLGSLLLYAVVVIASKDARNKLTRR